VGFLYHLGFRLLGLGLVLVSSLHREVRFSGRPASWVRASKRRPPLIILRPPIPNPNPNLNRCYFLTGLYSVLRRVVPTVAPIYGSGFRVRVSISFVASSRGEILPETHSCKYSFMPSPKNRLKQCFSYILGTITHIQPRFTSRDSSLPLPCCRFRFAVAVKFRKNSVSAVRITLHT